jgi:hypothetical protein
MLYKNTGFARGGFSAPAWGEWALYWTAISEGDLVGIAVSKKRPSTKDLVLDCNDVKEVNFWVQTVRLLDRESQRG